MSENRRNPNIIEQCIIERCVRNTRITYIEIFIFFLACDLTFWYLTVLAFGDSFLMGCMSLIMALVLGILLLAIYRVIKDIKIRSYQIVSGKGEWSIEFEGATAKTRHPVSKVNGSKITMIIPGMATMPKYDEIKNIEYEYVKVFEDPPPFGYDHIFISIEGKGFTEKHKTYIEKVKPIGILSIALSLAFCVLIVFCFMIEFDSPSLLYLCLGLSFIFIRTIFIWRHNHKLRKTLL